MGKYEEAKLNATSVNLDETIDFLHSFAELQHGTIKSQIPTINGLGITFQKSDRCIKFSTGPILSTQSPVQYQKSGYGFANPFEIITANRTYISHHGAGSLSLKMADGFSSEGELWELESNFAGGRGYYRAIFPLDDYTEIPVSHLLGEPFKTNNSFRAAGYITVHIDEFEIGFFDYQVDKKKFVFIECKNLIDREVFEDLVESIIHPFGLISGSLLRNEVNILKFDNSDFSNFAGFQFKKTRDSVISSLELINPRQHKDFMGLSKTEYFPINIFSKLSELCYNKKPFLRCISMINQARNLNVENQAASIFVALETIKQIIVDENIKSISPFVDPVFARKTIQEFKMTISNISESEFNDKASVLRKLENLNMVGNNDSFKLAFKLVGFPLTQEDEKCIAMRNRFLHGNIPFEDEPQSKREKGLRNITLKAHFLTCSLILKYAGFNGVVKDFLKYWDLMNDIPNDDLLFKSI